MLRGNAGGQQYVDGKVLVHEKRVAIGPHHPIVVVRGGQIFFHDLKFAPSRVPRRVVAGGFHVQVVPVPVAVFELVVDGQHAQWCAAWVILAQRHDRDVWRPLPLLQQSVSFRQRLVQHVGHGVVVVVVQWVVSWWWSWWL